MISIVTELESALEKDINFNSQFYHEYTQLAVMYQELIDKGVVSKRKSQLLSISDKATIGPIHFNRSDKM